MSPAWFANIMSMVRCAGALIISPSSGGEYLAIAARERATRTVMVPAMYICACCKRISTATTCRRGGSAATAARDAGGDHRELAQIPA